MSRALHHSRIETDGLVITPVEEVKRFLNESKELLEKGDPVQAHQ
jgi:hypothetical protein